MTHVHNVSEHSVFQVLLAVFSLREEGVTSDVPAVAAYLSQSPGQVRSHLLSLEQMGLADASTITPTMRGLVVAASMRRQSRKMAA